MKRQVAIFIETALAQTELEFTRLELFNDEKITVSSTIQNISDISKIFTDYSQGFTIPCSPTNNAIFQHFYQNDVDATIDYQNRYNAYIEIDTVLFRRGKIQLEKTNLKNGSPDSYSVTFYGAGVSLKDYFNEDKLSQLDYTTLNHDYTNTEVYNRVTVDSTVTDYNVRYPLITSNRVWQFGSSFPLPTANLPNWYEYPASNVNNIGDNAGEIVFTELFPAVRVASIFDLIESEYSITFNGLFLLSDLFRKAFLWFKNKQTFTLTSSNAIAIDLTASSGTLASAFNTTTNSFTAINSSNYNDYSHLLGFNVTAISIATTYYIDIYVNGIFNSAHSGSTTSSNINQFNIVANPESTMTFKLRADVVTTLTLNFTYQRSYVDTNSNAVINETGNSNNATATTTGLTNLQSLAPDLKIVDFVSGI
jgi:hypothetical protein